MATAEPEEAHNHNHNHNHKRWTLGVAAGALLVAGTFAAGTLGITGGATTTADSVPGHAPTPVT